MHVLCVCALSGIWLSAVAAEIEGRVVVVSDGETITELVHERQSFKMRLSGIETLEKKTLIFVTFYKTLSKRSDFLFLK